MVTDCSVPLRQFLRQYHRQQEYRRQRQQRQQRHRQHPRFSPISLSIAPCASMQVTCNVLYDSCNPQTANIIEFLMQSRMVTTFSSDVSTLARMVPIRETVPRRVVFLLICSRRRDFSSRFFFDRGPRSSGTTFAGGASAATCSSPPSREGHTAPAVRLYFCNFTPHALFEIEVDKCSNVIVSSRSPPGQCPRYAFRVTCFNVWRLSGSLLVYF